MATILCPLPDTKSMPKTIMRERMSGHLDIRHKFVLWRADPLFPQTNRVFIQRMEQWRD